MIELVNESDSHAMENKNTVLAFYDELLPPKHPAEIAERFLAPDYKQHNPIVEDGRDGFVTFFSVVAEHFPSASATIHRIIAVDDYVWVHAHWRNMQTNDENDPGFAVVDIWRINSDGKVAEHWDVLQTVGSPDDAAPWAVPGLPRANDNGLF